MATFFEKLTGSHAPAAARDLSEDTQKNEPRKNAPRRFTQPAVKNEEPSRPTRLKVDTEESAPEEAPAEIPEEEGELTVDIYDKGDDIVIQSTVAGVRPEDLDVSITNDTVTIRGRRERQEEVSEQNYYYKELFWGTFSRSVILPEEIEEDEAEATLKHGLLFVRLPKKKRGVVQKLKVKVT